MNPDTDPIVTTAQGAVRGLRQDGITAFLNIPYAAPPLDAGRFAPPQPHESWDGVRDATVPGPNAPQSERKLGSVDMSPYFGAGWNHGEDYLTVSVWTPAAVGGDLPVMVFTHGGGFVAGSTRSAMYDGSGFARDGVVLVTLNYRLGIAGFLDIPGAPVNRGLLDVVAALRWVRENIAAFGGDPRNVTLFGQSAGATIVGGVLATPEATGLFRRAIVQSGSGLGAFTTEQAARVTKAAAAALGIDPHVDAFADIDDERLVDAANRLAGIDLQTETHSDPLIGLSPFSLVLDTQPAESVSAGLSADVDLLIGTNTEEGNLYLAPVGNYSTSTAADVDAAAARSHPNPAQLVETYRKARPEASFGELRSAIMGDAAFGAGSWALAGAHAAHPQSATFGYEFAWRSPALNGELGATHAIELPFVFDLAHLPQLHGPNGLLGLDKPPADLAARVHETWVRFARTSNPGWDPYDSERRATMRIDAEWTQVDDPRGQERQAWRTRPTHRSAHPFKDTP
ncbi:carboxylesterase/lipase family protein [Streptomyces lunaelactis]|uniref:carboxylesterase/lipase family protein n=1 Tax=Streptomyces lunaelactis TaxID=1535768 RepID=UPI00158599E8|nr:carboxylesterase family protein [Streptomyces lunaelactis]NUK05943.1 carboxylesterase/lipase family protein [Streptomyces lunaelactis]NUK20420.1 carboxylesterase/lipase family protein [Streptomyces lunaelactis]NUK55197.1 carboxylesterase/lipase family protein [Streptomyces lunaelactis]NUK60340.1 carboxylesterase/lipase family protein [Streptomyces lunaelactis]NUK67034.1 carboxylesterase/lipase family protein [Streptomyces lunaelactis]